MLKECQLQKGYPVINHKSTVKKAGSTNLNDNADS